MLKDSAHFGNSLLGSRTFLDKLHLLGLGDAAEVGPEAQPCALKRVKGSPEAPTLHIERPNTFFEELTPELFQSRVLPAGPSASVRENESMMYFFNVKQPPANKSTAFAKALSSQVLSPSKVFSERRLAARDPEAQLDLHTPLAMPRISLMDAGAPANESPLEDALAEPGLARKSPENCFWDKHIASPSKGFNVKSSADGRAEAL